MLHLYAALAEKERRLISERTKAALVAKKAAGAALRAIRVEGATTLRSIAQALNRRGIKSPRGGTWYPSSVANLLSRSDSFL
jgi:DNA invertase Pin-like site-specific DNA recombinase